MSKKNTKIKNNLVKKILSKNLKYSAWIKQNRKKYQDKWVVLSPKGTLVGSGDNPTLLLIKAWEKGITTPFLHFIGREKESEIL